MGDGGQRADLRIRSKPEHRERWIALVVEGDDDQRDLIGAILEESEVRVIACRSAEAAIETMKTVGDSVVFALTDLDLEGAMDGVDLARHLSQRWPNTRLVAISGSFDGKRLALLPEGIRHLQKPWHALDIIIEMERAIAAHQPGFLEGFGVASPDSDSVAMAAERRCRTS